MTEHKECVKYAPPKSAYSLFDDPALQQAKAALTPEQREKYARAGEMMYDYDFEGSGLEKNLDKLISGAAREIAWTVSRGLHPSFLNKDELRVMKESRGEKWYTRFGYTEKDLTEIVNTPSTLPIIES